MAFDEYLAERIRINLKEKNIHSSELKMMGGLCFTVDEKMLCGIHIDKKSNESLLMARIGEDAYTAELEREECLPMDFTGRPMKGYIFVKAHGFDIEEDLSRWLDLCLSFNPMAKSSKRKKK